jgi:phosphomannomutase / phosphoglucomutase
VGIYFSQTDTSDKKQKSLNSSITLSALISELPKIHNTPEIRVACPDNMKVIAVEKIKSMFMDSTNLPIKPREVITVDGIRAIFENGWALVRASNTQPMLVMRFEATDTYSLDTIKSATEHLVNGVLNDLQPSA